VRELLSSWTALRLKWLVENGEKERMVELESTLLNTARFISPEIEIV